MILSDKKKRPASMILEMLSKPDMEPEFAEPKKEDAVDAAARSFISSMEAKDPKAVVSSLKTLLSLCEESEEPEQELE